MKTNWLLFLFAFCPQAILAQSPVFQYVSPKPNSILVSDETNIILRSAAHVDRSSLASGLIRVEGSRSGPHSGDVILSDDGRTLVFNPRKPFVGNEIVSVSLERGLRTLAGAQVPTYSFCFTTAPDGVLHTQGVTFDEDIPRPTALPDDAHLSSRSAADLLPAPPITIDSVDNPAPGCIFLATWDRNVPQRNYANFIFVLDSAGGILDSVRIAGPASDFKVQPNGLLSYSAGSFSGIVPSGAGWTYYVLDSNLAVVDSFKMKNGYSTDGHEFQLLPNGHALLMSYPTVTYDMSTIVPGGKPDATLTICVLQEQDVDKNVVFEWRDFDHIPITDSDAPLTTSQINYTTLNAFVLDDDGNFLVSSRNLSAILKISRENGEILWRWGGRGNEFTFVGEHPENAPYYFARQHHICRLPNGHVTLFDNGEFHTPPYSRAVEYALDEVAKVATMVSEYRYPTGNIFSLNGGAAHRLSNGGWFMGFGNLAPQSPIKRIVVEAHADGSTALELSVPNNVTTYRIAKQPWKRQIQTPSITVPEVHQGDTYSFNTEGETTGVRINYLQLSGDLYNMATITQIPYGPVRPEFIDHVPRVYPVSILYDGASIYSQNAEFHIDLAVYPQIKHPGSTSLYARTFAGQGLFVELPTTYDSSANELVATTTTFGEIVFGEPDVPQGKAIPVLIEPANSRRALANSPVLFRWTAHSLVESFQLQLGMDSLFNAVEVDTSLRLSYFTEANLITDQKYYWRVRSNSSAGASDWSAVWSFEPTEAFIEIQAPNGGEEIHQGDTVITRWDTNVADSVRVKLLRGTADATVIGKTLASNRAFQWNVSMSLAPDSAYRLSIVAYADSMLADTSDAVFSVSGTNAVGPVSDGVPTSAQLMQNFPNPFNPTTEIRFQISPARLTGNTGAGGDVRFVRLAVYDLLGREVTTLVNEVTQPGVYSVQWNAAGFPSGVYFCRLQAGLFTETKKLVLMR